ncbi:AraC family transcriptional regulator [Lysinibacillus sp. PLM2]|nr:AraC family transcriptional regulator [Lysinibacillus sp. PLM2]
MNLTILNSIRTNNFNDQNIMQKISKMWSEASNFLSSQDKVLYGLYYNYESDYKGDYTLSVAIEDIENESSINIPITPYKIFKVESSDEFGILNTWKEIWNLEEKGILERAYSFDFEKYDHNGQIEIHIAIK